MINKQMARFNRLRAFRRASPTLQHWHTLNFRARLFADYVVRLSLATVGRFLLFVAGAQIGKVRYVGHVGSLK